MPMKVLLSLLICIPLAIWAQNPNGTIPRDTSFSVWSAHQKLKTTFPEAIPVKPQNSQLIISEPNTVYYSLNGRHLHADIFLPNATQKSTFPAVILIHGGGWASGNKSHLVPLAQKLAENGFVSLSVEYRLSPEAAFPAAIRDLKTAVKWLKSNASKYKVDTTKIAVLGTSAGATLATFIGVTGQNPAFPSHALSQSVSDIVQAIVNIDGIVDFSHPAESGKDNDAEKPSAAARWFGFTYKQNPTLWHNGSPITHTGKNTPPTLFINSAIPRFHAGRDQYTSILSQHNIYYAIYTIGETPHPFWLFHPWFNQTYPLVVGFLNTVFSENQ